MTASRPDTPESLFADRVRSDPGSPLVTFYDDATGERAELSAKSLANWVAKTHYLLVDALGLGVGDAAYVGLPVHWLAAPVLLGCWSAGLAVRTDPDGCAVAFADAGSLPAPALFDEAYAVSLLSMARPDVPPAGAQDYSTSVRPMPDHWAGVRPQAGPADAALTGAAGTVLDRAGLVTAARARAADLGLAAGGRLLWTGGPDWISALLAPLVVGGSVVLVRNPDPAKLESRAAGERATVVRP